MTELSEVEIGVVITLSPDRHDNVRLVLDSLNAMDMTPGAVVLLCDGPPKIEVGDHYGFAVRTVVAPKHEPGMEQPRNLGVRMMQERWPEITHAWFLDSDVLVAPQALTAYYAVIPTVGTGTILIGPYEWMPDGAREQQYELHSDFRWPMFNEEGLGPHVGKLGVALGCFGGNLVWPIDEFMRVGGFHPQLHHGRCEDGELGLRAASFEIPMALVGAARGFHMEHPRNGALAEARNQRDVPLLNSWHPWVEQQGIVVTEKDGARFDFVCACGAQVNTLEMWAHMATHVGQEIKPPPSEDGLILPDDLR